MPQQNSIFDMIGPIMVGPSSSHTAGVVRIGRVVHYMLKGTPDSSVITFYNSFARTYEGHGSDRAVIAGLMGFAVDDKRIKNIFPFAQKEHFRYSFKAVANLSTYHPNTVEIVAEKSNKEIIVLGESTGGGLIRIVAINGFNAGFVASSYSLIIYADDVEGSIAFIASVLANEPTNIATMSVSRKGKHNMACLVIEIDSELKTSTIDYLNNLHWVKEIAYIPPC